MPIKEKISIEIKCRCGRNTMVNDVKPAKCYVEVTRFMCDCGETFHIHDYHHGITTYMAVTPEIDVELLRIKEENKNRGRKRCMYPMSEFFEFEDMIPEGVRVSTPEDCEACGEMRSCQDSKHCLFEISLHCLKID